MTDPNAERFPDRLTPLIGWRVWQVTSDDAAPLTSITQQAVRWVPHARHEATCLCSGSAGMLHGHTCGIHAATTLDAVIGYYQGNGIGIWQPAYVVGCVRLWGRVIVHDNGIYRAQYAYPDAFVWDARLNLCGKALAQYLATVYGVAAEAVQLPFPVMQPTFPSPWPQQLQQIAPPQWPLQQQYVWSTTASTTTHVPFSLSLFTIGGI